MFNFKSMSYFEIFISGLVAGFIIGIVLMFVIMLNNMSVKLGNIEKYLEEMNARYSISSETEGTDDEA